MVRMIRIKLGLRDNKIIAKLAKNDKYSNFDYYMDYSIYHEFRFISIYKDKLYITDLTMDDKDKIYPKRIINRYKNDVFNYKEMTRFVIYMNPDTRTPCIYNV
jgi:hypothetical protein